MRAVLDAKKLSIIYQTSVQFHSYNVPTYLSIYTCIRDSGFLTLISPLLSDSDMDPQDFEKINGLLDRETELREKIKEQVLELDKKARTMVGLLNKVHSTPHESIPTLTTTVTPILLSCKDVMAALADLIPPNEFWRWKDMWSHSMRSAVFSAAFVEYLTNGKLITIEQVAEILGNRLALPVEDYLQGIINMVNELSRLAVNAVTMGNFDEPIRISIFVKDLYAGFSVLNLKNDVLRRRFDSIKYDLKKIEEVVYDVSLRKLSTTPVLARAS